MKKVDLKNIEKIVNDLEVTTDLKKVPMKGSGSVTHTIEEYRKIEDNFIRYRVMVNDAVEMYNQARSIAAVTETGLSASIYRMAEPFRKGHFTLAVVGKMSAGKSTFINALLGEKNLLPTGYFQTTCTITSISHSEKMKLSIVYGDNREEEIYDNISEVLARSVAIEPEFTSLPVNNINRLILSNVPKKEICSEKLIREMEKVSNTTIDVELLGKYIDKHPKKLIPTEVAIECPLSENYRGWRIVDTPGVDAVGGIEDDTRKFLCGKDKDGNHNVDAIIFILAAKGDMQSKSLNEFVNDTIGNLTEEAKKRAFFVLTHATSLDFITRKKEIMGLAKQLFVDYAHIGDESRLIAVDSLASLLEIDSSLDFKSLVKSTTLPPSHWDKEVWKDCRNLIKQVKGILEDDEDIEFNNENARCKLHEMANFDTFRNYLNQFVKQEKNKAFSSIIETIEKDINACIDIREQDIRILETNLGKSADAFLDDLKAEKKKLDQFQTETNIKFAKLSGKYGKSKVNEKFKEGGLTNITPEVFKTLSSLREMREKAESLGNHAESITKDIQENIITDVKTFIEISQQSKNFVLPLIDYKNIASKIESQAEKDSDRTKEVERRKAKTSSGLFIRKRLGDFFGTNWGYRVWKETVHYTDMELAAISFCENLIIEMDNYRNQIAEKLEKQIDYIDKDIKLAIKKRKEDYDAMAKNTDLADQIKHKSKEIKHLKAAVSNFSIYHLKN